MNRSPSQNAALYFHFPCFDGIISAVLALDFLERQGWRFKRLNPVGYALRESWLSTKLAPYSAVVDFLFHPDAMFWADHHSTTFLNENVRDRFERNDRPWAFYDSAASSCASVLWRNFSLHTAQDYVRLEEMVRWAEKIDSAGYDSVEEAIFGDAPALRISLSLARADEGYARFLIRALRYGTLAAVAGHWRVERRFRRTRKLVLAGMERFRESASLQEGDIVVFDLPAKRRDIVSRYAPFYFYPQARYSIGLVRESDRAKITAMRNPWREFQSVPLGKIFARHGGGGHERVGAVILSRRQADRAQLLLKEMLSEIRKEESGTLVPA